MEEQGTEPGPVGWGQRLAPCSGKGERPPVLAVIVLSLVEVDLVVVVAGSAERSSTGELSCGSVVKRLLHGSPKQILMKETVHSSKQFVGCSWWTMDAKCTIPNSQGGPEMKYLLQGGMTGKGSLLAKSSRLLVPH